MSFTRLFLFFTSLITFSNGAGQVPCDSVDVAAFAISVLKTCFMQHSTVVDAPDFIISTPRDETVEGLRFTHNKNIFFLPTETAKTFPNLIMYSAWNCSIKVVKKENFKNLNTIVAIYLSDNQIETVSSDTFEDLTSLEMISLSKFLLKNLPSCHVSPQIETK